MDLFHKPSLPHKLGDLSNQDEKIYRVNRAGDEAICLSD